MSKATLQNLLTKRSAIITIVLAVMTAAGFWLGKDLKLKLSLTDLLPDDHPSVLKFEKITNIVGGVGYLIVLLEAEDAKSHLEVAPKLKEKFDSHRLVRTSYFEREDYFFSTRMLYYLSLKELGELEDTIDKQITQTKRKVFDLGLWDEEELNSAPDIDPRVREQAQEASNMSPHLQSEDGKEILFMIKPTFDSTDLGKTTELIEYTRRTLGELLPANVSYELAGRYFNKLEDSYVIKRDIGLLGGLAIVLICLILYLYLRSFRALLVIFIPVVMGLGITAGFARLFIGHINIVTGFLMGIVSGLGVDYGIHMVLRMRLEKQEPSSDHPDPIWRTIASSGHAVFVGAIAAAFSFYFLCGSSFRAFSEFGFICGTGIAAVLFCLLFSFSALSRWFKLENASYANKSSGWGVLPVLSSKREVFLGLTLTLVAALGAFFVRFEYDFDKMLQHSAKVKRLTEKVGEIYGRSVAPSVLAVPELSVAKDVEETLKEQYFPNIVNFIVSGATVIPENQDQKQVILKRIKKKTRKFKDKWLKREMNISGKAVRRWVNAKPFSFEEIPIQLQDALRGRGQKDFLIYVYPAVALNTATGVTTYARMVHEMEEKFPSMLTGSDAVVFSEILDLINRDGSIILLVIFFSVGIFIWLNVRRWDDTLTSYLPLLLSLPIGMGLMAAFGIKFNIFNIAIIPSFVAMGIDVPIHIVHRAREVRSGFKAARDLAASIHLALSTAGVGFGVLIFSGAGVLRSLGWIAFLGTVAIWWTGMFILPALLELYYRRKDGCAPGASGGKEGASAKSPNSGGSQMNVARSTTPTIS